MRPFVLFEKLLSTCLDEADMIEFRRIKAFVWVCGRQGRWRSCIFCNVLELKAMGVNVMCAGVRGRSPRPLGSSATAGADFSRGPAQQVLISGARSRQQEPHMWAWYSPGVTSLKRLEAGIRPPY
eukprot:366532-Chlamydomonas_euryale.AAC.2